MTRWLRPAITVALSRSWIRARSQTVPVGLAAGAGRVTADPPGPSLPPPGAGDGLAAAVPPLRRLDGAGSPAAAPIVTRSSWLARSVGGLLSGGGAPGQPWAGGSSGGLRGGAEVPKR